MKISYNIPMFLSLVMSLLYTKVFHRHAKIVRLPIYIRNPRYVSIASGVSIGRMCRIDAFPPQNERDYVVSIGRRCQINDYVHIAAIEGVDIADDVLIASGVFISDSNHGEYNGNEQSHPDSLASRRPLIGSPVSIKRNVWLGENVCVLPGVVIGENSIIGANSVVTKSIPADCIAVGAPASIIKRFNRNNSQWEPTGVTR